MFQDMDTRKPHDWIGDLNLKRSLDWLQHLQAESAANGAHPQLARDIEALQDHIAHLEHLIKGRGRLALEGWEAAKSADDELSMYVAGQEMAAVLKEVNEFPT